MKSVTLVMNVFIRRLHQHALTSVHRSKEQLTTDFDRATPKPANCQATDIRISWGGLARPWPGWLGGRQAPAPPLAASGYQQPQQPGSGRPGSVLVSRYQVLRQSNQPCRVGHCRPRTSTQRNINAAVCSASDRQPTCCDMSTCSVS